MTGRLRLGELTVLAGAICLIVSLFEPSYQSPVGNLDIWETFGAGAVLLLVALCAGLAVVIAALTERESPALPVSSAVWCVLVGAIGLLAAVIRVLERPDHATGLCIGSWLALLGAFATLLGAWLVVRDERPSRYSPASPVPRPGP